jgi:hypothetical protein
MRVSRAPTTRWGPDQAAGLAALLRAAVGAYEEQDGPLTVYEQVGSFPHDRVCGLPLP